jgi:hypothetical protein
MTRGTQCPLIRNSAQLASIEITSAAKALFKTVLYRSGEPLRHPKATALNVAAEFLTSCDRDS